MNAYDGFFDFFWDEEAGKVWLRLERFDEPFLYVSSLASGLGSNPIGLDRGQLGESRVVRFRRVGPKVYLEQENLKYRAQSVNESERRAVRDSFASSILWAGDLKKDGADSFVVDITDFLLHDVHDCIGRLASRGQGEFSLSADRSFVYLPHTKSFPDNSEFEVALTFVSKTPGPLVQRTSAYGTSVTLRQHHSFVRLPDNNYSPRRFDPRCGCFRITYSDYAVPITEPLEQHFITRHRLRKRDPDAEKSPPIEPIIYYVDPGVPQPVREALIEGAQWWNDAFEDAGFTHAFQVRVLPTDADPMDVRYNVIQWVHRATRGWSYGQSVVDPRTGEIIKGHVLLGSLRVRQDHLLMEGLGVAGSDSAPACACHGMGAVPDESYLAAIAENETSLDVSLARIRQLAAHEVGHTLGFAHNFAASTYGDRASVMDYPAPRAKIVDGKIDLSDAYATGVGIWDRFIVKYAYVDVARSDEEQTLQRLVTDAIANKMLYITDADARPPGAAHPLGNLWDNGTDPIEALRHEMRVRRIAMDQFDASALADGQPWNELEKVFVPVFLHHRYQVDATAKMIGGFRYHYAVKGDQQVPLEQIPVGQQRRALHELLKTIRPKELAVPQRIVNMIPPRTIASPSDRERFSTQISPMFDPASAIRAAAQLTLGNLLQPQRASRLARIDEDEWTLGSMIDAIIQQTCTPGVAEDPGAREAARIVRQVFIEQLIGLADSGEASHDARSIALSRLRRVRQRIEAQQQDLPAGGIESAHLGLIASDIERFIGRPHPSARQTTPIELPPGSPIGRSGQ